MNTTELMQRFRQFSTADLSFSPSDTGTISEVIFETKSLRIVLTRYSSKPDEIEVDVEVPLPPLQKTNDIDVFKKFMDVMIDILEYLNRLRSSGFSIQLLREEGILVASGNLRADADEPVFEVLGFLNRTWTI